MDFRNRAFVEVWWVEYDEKAETVTADVDGERLTFPLKLRLCPVCHGRGKYVNPNVDSEGITGEEMERLGPEFLNDYLNGVYDVKCVCCAGKRVVPAIPEEIKEHMEAVRREELEWLAICESERRMGC